MVIRKLMASHSPNIMEFLETRQKKKPSESVLPQSDPLTGDGP